MKKRIISGLLIFVVVFCMIPISMPAYATSYSSDDAISWLRSKEGQAIDYDGQYGAQCVDLVMAYYKYLIGWNVGGNGCDYATNTVPSGWTRTKGGYPQKGDILVYAGGTGAGHVAIYESDNVTWHQNAGGKYVRRRTDLYYADYKAYDGAPYWGCIHPNFNNTYYEIDTRYPTPFYAYTISSAAKTQCYDYVDGPALSTNNIYNTDECTIQEVYTNGWCKFLCPWSGGSVATKYAPISTFIYDTNYNPNYQYLLTDVQGYKRHDLSESYKYADINGNGKGCLRLGNTGVNGYTQIMYWISGYGNCVMWVEYPGSQNDSLPIGSDFYAYIIQYEQWRHVTNDNTNVSLRSETGEDNQIWKFVYQGNGYYKILSCADGKALDVYGAYSDSGTNVQVYPSHDSDAQLWRICGRWNGEVTLEPKCSTCALDVNCNGTEEGVNVQIWTYNGTSAQKFSLYTDVQSTLKYDANGGSGAPASCTKAYLTTFNLSTTIPTRSGYTFLGWSTSSNATTPTYKAGESYVMHGSTTLYAVWRKSTYTNTIDHWIYVGTGGNNDNGTYKYMGSSTFTGTPGATVTIPTSLVQSYTGYYNTGAAGSYWGTNTWSDKKIGSTFVQPEKSISIEYRYHPNEYTVSYNANGGSGVPSSQIKRHGIALTLSSVIPVKSGYTFKGWSTSSTATTATYQAGGTYSANSSVTLYAVWTKGCPNDTHSYTTKVTAPTCTSQGYTTHTCSLCGHSYKDSYVNTTNHSYSYKTATAPTTTATGTITGTCSKCSKTTSITLPKLNTTDYTYSVTKAATCTVAGTGCYTWKTTTYGTYKFDVTIPATNHSYASKVTAPTCTTQGYTTHTCSLCGHSYKDSYTNAQGHAWGEYVYNNDATNNTNGTKTRKCNVCNATETVTAEGTILGYYAGGSGSENDPYLIANAKQLDNVRYNLDAHFKLINDIAFSDGDFAEGGQFYNDGKGWEPIGFDSASAFEGTFDGNGYLIRNLYIRNMSYSDVVIYAGVFGFNKGTLKNLYLNNFSITVGSADITAYAGSVAGYNTGIIENCSNESSKISSDYAGGIVAVSIGTIKNCYNTGSVEAKGTGYNYAGGLVGTNGGTIEDCYNVGIISSLYSAGGVAGRNQSIISGCYNIGNVTVSSDSISIAGGIVGNDNGSISKCYNKGIISAETTSLAVDASKSGGIIGLSSASVIENCYNAGKVISTNYAGGIVGDDKKETTIDKCYNIGVVTAEMHGAIVGYAYKSLISDCYYLDNVEVEAGKASLSTVIAIKCTKELMKKQSTFVGYDFDTIWNIGSVEYPYPVIKSITYNHNHVFDNSCDNSCNGCGYTRLASHAFGDYIYNNDATTEADGTETRTCESCGATETRTAEGTKLPAGSGSDTSVIPDSRLPKVEMNESGNGVTLDMLGSWATRVYWGYIGEEEIPYKWFDDFRLGCGTEYNADFTPRADKTYSFTKKGYYRFVLKCIISGDSAENYEYKDMVYTFYYDGSVKPAVPYLKVIDGNTVQIEKNGLAVTKLYYGNIGSENVPYGWFNDFWGKALGTKTYKVDFGVTYGEKYTLVTKGFYNFVIVYKDEAGATHEIVYTVEAKQDVGIITASNGKATLTVDNVGGKVNKLYYGYIGTDATGVVDYDTLKAAAGTLTGDWTMKTGRTYNLTKKGYYGFCVNYTMESFINGGFTNVTYDIIYIVENN